MGPISTINNVNNLTVQAYYTWMAKPIHHIDPSGHSLFATTIPTSPLIMSCMHTILPQVGPFVCPLGVPCIIHRAVSKVMMLMLSFYHNNVSRSKLSIVWYTIQQFSVPWIEYPIGGSSKKGSHVYFLLQVFWVILLFCQIDINVTIVYSDITIVVPW